MFGFTTSNGLSYIVVKTTEFKRTRRFGSSFVKYNI